MAAKHLGHDLKAIADAKDRNTESEHSRIRPWRPLCPDTGRSAGEDDAFRGKLPDLISRSCEREYLAVDAAFPDTPRDKLAVLRTEIKDYNSIMISYGHICLLMGNIPEEMNARLPPESIKIPVCLSHACIQQKPYYRSDSALKRIHRNLRKCRSECRDEKSLEKKVTAADDDD